MGIKPSRSVTGRTSAKRHMLAGRPAREAVVIRFQGSEVIADVEYTAIFWADGLRTIGGDLRSAFSAFEVSDRGQETSLASSNAQVGARSMLPRPSSNCTNFGIQCGYAVRYL